MLKINITCLNDPEMRQAWGGALVFKQKSVAELASIRVLLQNQSTGPDVLEMPTSFLGHLGMLHLILVFFPVLRSRWGSKVWYPYQGGLAPFLAI